MNRPNEVLTRPAVGNHPVRHAQVEANGAAFHVVEQGQGPAVLFLHGLPDTVATWRSQMQAVSENGGSHVLVSTFVPNVGNWPHSAETASLPRMSIEAEQLHTGSDWHFRNDEP